MKLVTIQAAAIKSIFEVLKDILNDVNIYFKPEGMCITTLDTSKTSLVDMFLAADNFEEYSCEHEIIAGINILNTFRLFKSITNNDVLTIEITGKDFANVHIVNENKKTSTTFQLKLLDINESRIEIPDTDVETTITTMLSVDFQRICRDMSNIGDEIIITRESNKLTLACEGDFANQETSIECVNESPKISGLYSLKYLNIFTKASGMCSSVQLIQETGNRFLILKYNVANLGDLKFYLATKINEDQK
jgi:proliferating cell nuclear antigen